MADGDLSLADVWQWFADHECGSSPLYTEIAGAVADDTELLEMVRRTPPQCHLPLVLLAAVHALLLGGLDHPLGAVYRGESTAAAAPLFQDLCREHWATLAELMSRHHTNTNEVARSAIIGPAIAAAADVVGEPFALLDVGCSAGLNLMCDRYRLDYGTAGVTGPHDAPVRIPCEVVAGTPPIRSRLPEIQLRLGLDRDPVDVRDPDAAQWLLACIWPDTGRLPRVRAAIEVASQDPPTLIAGDMVGSIEPVIAGVARELPVVVVTSWAVAYLSPPDRRRFRERLVEASRGRVVAWISGDGAGVVDLFDTVSVPRDTRTADACVLGLVIARDGVIESVRHLGFVQPHGAWIDWRDREVAW